MLGAPRRSRFLKADHPQLLAGLLAVERPSFEPGFALPATLRRSWIWGDPHRRRLPPQVTKSRGGRPIAAMMGCSLPLRGSAPEDAQSAST